MSQVPVGGTPLPVGEKNVNKAKKKPQNLCLTHVVDGAWI